MRKSILEDIKTLLDSPIYVFQKIATGYSVDKLILNDDSKFGATRYLLTGNIACTCLGFMKFERCKHLAMLNGHDSWAEGVPTSVAQEEVERIIQTIGQKMPGYPENWKIDTERAPEILKTITLSVPVPDKSFEMVASLKQFGNAGNLGIIFRKKSE